MNPELDTCDREDLRFSLGALALGALDADEAREVRQHLADCPGCQAEYTSFVGVKRIIDTGVGLVGTPMPGLEGPPVRRMPWLTPLRRRIALGTAGAVAAVAMIGAGFAAGRHGTVPKDTQAAQTAQTALQPVSQGGVTAQLSYEGRGWGTWIDAKMSGAPVGTVCTLYVYGKDGKPVALSSWKSVGKQIDVPAATSLSPDQIDHFEVRVDDRDYDISVPMG